MTETQPTGHHADSGAKAYFVIFGALLFFTLMSFVVNYGVRAGTLQSSTGFVLILGVAVCKAVLVGMFFMHLKYDWSRLYFLIIPVMILGTMMVIVLLPDIVLAWPAKSP